MKCGLMHSDSTSQFYYLIKTAIKNNYCLKVYSRLCYMRMLAETPHTLGKKITNAQNNTVSIWRFNIS